MPDKLTDEEAKKALLTWPACAGEFGQSDVWPVPAPGLTWLRAQPVEKKVTHPRLRSAGSKAFRTQPDGLWLCFATDAAFVDAFVVEHCQTVQNLNDKRSRYVPALHSLVVDAGRAWLRRKIVRPGNVERAHWRLAGMSEEPTRDLVVPVRSLRVLFALKRVDYEAWSRDQVPAAHEYFCRHSSLRSYTSQDMQRFLARMTHRSHFYTRPGT